MTSNSGRAGFCSRCGCANNNHAFALCEGYDRDKRKKKHVRCTFEWSRCSTAGHEQYVKYIDCFRCPNHPGGAPFGGTVPGSPGYVSTADELGVPWPGATENSAIDDTYEYQEADYSQQAEESSNPLYGRSEAQSSSQTSQSLSGHRRQLTQESIDPLQEDQAVAAVPTTTIAVSSFNSGNRNRTLSDSTDPLQSDDPAFHQLIGRFNQLQLGGPSSERNAAYEQATCEDGTKEQERSYVETYVRENRPGLWFIPDGSKHHIQSNEDDWEEHMDDDYGNDHCHRIMSQLVCYDGEDANSVITRSSSVWREARRAAEAMHALPANTLNLKALLSRAPQMPDVIPNTRWIKGFSTWENTSGACSLKQKSERTWKIHLRKKFPTKFGISSSKNFTRWEGSQNNGIALLVLGWAYILSASLAERQNIRIEYQEPLAPPSSMHQSPIIVNPSYASPQELAWWKALTNDRWMVKDTENQVLPWSVEGSEMKIEIVGRVVTIEAPPTAKQAAQYLARFCRAYSLGTQCTAALAAVLCIPLHSSRSALHPVKLDLPRPHLSKRRAPGNHRPPPEFRFLGYFMTLSIEPWILGPSLWSVFWDPDVPCNFAGAWMGPIAAILKPVIDDNNLELLVRIMSFTHAAPLWLGIALAGKNEMIRSIMPYLTKAQDFADACPSMDAAAWFGQPQSFMDLRSSEPLVKDGQVSRAHVWRLRHDFHTEYEEADYSQPPAFAWPPFGKMRIQDVEFEIRDHLQCSHCWSYNYWTWLPGRSTDKGFSWDHSTTASRVRPPASPIHPASPDPMQNNLDVSKRITEKVFQWCHDQVEEGFGNGKLLRSPHVQGYVRYSLDNCVKSFFQTYTDATQQACDDLAQRLVGPPVEPVHIQGQFSYTVIAGEQCRKIVQFRAVS
ncbi:hypothetical protein S40288_10097 [Stachybotrys chartarum IBT 40288]|nr:hypothetical protein S40288_10097 [Stachybotrys chartarum IBT 40288]